MSSYEDIERVRGVVRFEPRFSLSGPLTDIDNLSELYDKGVGLHPRRHSQFKSIDALEAQWRAQYAQDPYFKRKQADPDEPEIVPAPRVYERQLHSSYCSFFREMLAEAVPSDVEIDVFFPRLYLDSHGFDWRVEALMCCLVSSGSCVKYLLWDVDNFAFLSDAAVGMCLSGDAGEIMNLLRFPEGAVYSAEAYQAIMERMQTEGLDALPHRLARQMGWRIWQQAARQEILSSFEPHGLMSGFGCTSIPDAPGEFILDLLPRGAAHVQLLHEETGEISPIALRVTDRDAI